MGSLTVHPHACGADAPKPFMLLYQVAVHPHACGADCCMVSCPAPALRFIPTRVGQIPTTNGHTAMSTGSSPRVWGRCNGRLSALQCRTVHPHVCGADGPVHQQHQVVRAVHPHACGADISASWSGMAGEPVHPHACGADVFGAFQRWPALHGSSPRVWGRCASSFPQAHLMSGSSPRVWGRFSRCSASNAAISVHPHACGADVFLPRSRGKRSTVHPHACGADAQR